MWPLGEIVLTTYHIPSSWRTSFCNKISILTRASRCEVVAYLRKVRRIVPGDLKFVIEDATEGDAKKVGITW